MSLWLETSLRVFIPCCSQCISLPSRKSMISTSRRSTVINKCTFCNSCIFRCTMFVLLACLTTVLQVSKKSKVTVFPPDMSRGSVYFPSNEPKWAKQFLIIIFWVGIYFDTSLILFFNREELCIWTASRHNTCEGDK